MPEPRARDEASAKDTHKLLIAAEAEIATLRAQVERLTAAATAWQAFKDATIADDFFAAVDRLDAAITEEVAPSPI